MLPTSKNRFAAALPCAAALLLAGCATPCTTMVQPGAHHLSEGIPVQVSPHARLTLVAVEDSRCPDGVQCIWAGRIVYRFELQSCGKTEHFTLTPAASPPPREQPQATSGHRLDAAPGLRVTLSAAEPAPRGAAQASPVHAVDVVIAAD